MYALGPYEMAAYKVCRSLILSIGYVWDYLPLSRVRIIFSMEDD